MSYQSFLSCPGAAVCPLKLANAVSQVFKRVIGRMVDRGTNIIFVMEVDGVKVCHIGDLGHPLSSQQIADVGKVDVLLIPVGGFFTIDAAAATGVCKSLNPRVIIPMHFKNERCEFPIAPVDDFLEGKETVVKAEATEAEFKITDLPDQVEVVVLDSVL